MNINYFSNQTYVILKKGSEKMKKCWESESIEILPHRQTGRGSSDYEKILVVVPTSDTSVFVLPVFTTISGRGNRNKQKVYRCTSLE